MSTYWMEAVAQALEAAGLVATDEQKASIADSMQTSAENWDRDGAEDPPQDELQSLEQQLHDERRAADRRMRQARHDAEVEANHLRMRVDEERRKAEQQQRDAEWRRITGSRR